jgi:hypothetical protein
MYISVQDYQYSCKRMFMIVHECTHLYMSVLILQSPPSKETWKRQCKSKVISWWEERLRGKAALLPSLVYFRPSYMSLTTPHPLWTLAESGYEVSKATIVATMLSGRYASDYHARHWSRTNPDGFCQLCLASGHAATLGTLEHLLLRCPALAATRAKCSSHWASYIQDKPFLLPIVRHHTLIPGLLHMELLLDPTSCPLVIGAVQVMGEGIISHLLYMSRTWCHAHHLKRKRLLRLYNII